MSIGFVLLIVVLVIALGGFRDWGPGPFYGAGYRWGGGGLGIVVLILLLLLLLG